MADTWGQSSCRGRSLPENFLQASIMIYLCPASMVALLDVTCSCMFKGGQYWTGEDADSLIGLAQNWQKLVLHYSIDPSVYGGDARWVDAIMMQH